MFLFTLKAVHKSAKGVFFKFLGQTTNPNTTSLPKTYKNIKY